MNTGSKRVKQVVIALLGGFIILWIVGGALSVLVFTLLRNISDFRSDHLLSQQYSVDFLKTVVAFSIVAMISSFLAGLFVGRIIGEKGRWYSTILVLLFAGVQLAFSIGEYLCVNIASNHMGVFIYCYGICGWLYRGILAKTH